jgi:tol-pal system protein YbgF
MAGHAFPGKVGRRAARGLVAGLCAALFVSGCATKKDLKLLRDEVVRMQVRQDSLFREMQRQNRMLLDTLRSSFSMQLDAQGQTSHRFQQLEQQVTRTEEVLLQLQTLVSQLTDRLERAPPAPSGGATQAAAAGGGRDAAEAYALGMAKMQEQSWAAARVAFEQILSQYANDPLAPDAQYQFAETFAAEGDTVRALVELEKVEARWSNSPRAPGALLRAGILAEESGNRAAARAYYERVRQQYPNTDEGRLARQALTRLRG